MKLIKCHIENFGKLHNFDFNFSIGLNSIKEENGWGKSTFAAFIKSMFYGLPSTTKRNLDENERKKYTPWQGGNFGGNIEFEIGGKQYRIERFFGKNNAEDTFSLIDIATGKHSKDYNENIGEQIFDLDEDAFERCVFIPQKALNSSINESISNKLTNLIQGTTEKYNYENAQDMLDKKRASLSNNKGTGQIQTLESQIEDIAGKINELNTSTFAIADIQNKVDEYDKNIAEVLQDQEKIKKQIQEYSKAQQKVANKELYDRLNNKTITTNKELKEKEQILNGINTNQVEVDTYISIQNEILKYENKLQINQEYDYVNKSYDDLLAYFDGENNIPTAEKIKQINDDIVKYNNLKNQTESIAQKKQSANENSKKSKIFCIVAILSMLSLIAGAVLLKTFLTVAVALFVVGGVLLLASGFMYLVNMINEKTKNLNNINYEQLQSSQNEIIKLQKEIENFVNIFEDKDTDYSVAINNIIAKKKEFEIIKQQKEEKAKENKQLSAQIYDEKQKIESYLSQFNIDKNSSFMDNLTLIKQTIIDIANLKENLKAQQDELDTFKKEKNFDIDENLYLVIDISQLQAQEKSYQDQIDLFREDKSHCIAKINKISEEICALDDLENEKESLENTLCELKKEFNAIKNAQKYLKCANESLAIKFVQPMKTRLNKYLKLISSKDFENLKLDTDFNISFEEYGKYREVDYYSKGYKNVIDLCMRLSLIDVLFENEKPFIILDDPFINLDDNKTQSAKQFLQDMSNTYQIIYFSCHKSRC